MRLIAVCFGELLWDVFPTYRNIGGAPLNVTFRLNSLGMETFMVSKVGRDQQGIDILSYLDDSSISKSFIQIDQSFKTGEVTVNLDDEGCASYTINYPAAWDKINDTSNLEKLVAKSNVFIFGSLICRDIVSKETLFNLLNLAVFKVFDVNLRPPNYDQMLLLVLMKKSDFIKFNDEEILEICKYNNLNYNSLEEQIREISLFTNTQQICVTLGSNGAVLYIDKRFYYNRGFQVIIADTVGAGDSFLAGLIYQLLNKEQPQKSIDFACAIGALVASSKGANPTINKDQINKTLSSV